MACNKKEKEGYCSHFQCLYPDRTALGYECVEMADGFCEIGEDCLNECNHSWRSGTDRASQAEAAWEAVLIQAEFEDDDIPDSNLYFR